MNAQKQRCLKTELARIVQSKRAAVNRAEACEKEPAEVRKARQLVGRYEDALLRRYGKAHTRIHAGSNAVKKIILFGTEKEALAAVEKFERAKPLI